VESRPDGLKVSVTALLSVLNEEDQQENRPQSDPATGAPATPTAPTPAEQLVRRRAPNHTRTGHLRS
jgi:hypothetical protein